jgi:N-acyl-D-amino-acid deacylase
MKLTRVAVACLAGLSMGHLQAQAPRYDTIIRHGTVIDGSGNPRYDADIAVRNGFIVAIGDLAGATAATEIEARGLFVTPGFINIHSHA